MLVLTLSFIEPPSFEPRLSSRDYRPMPSLFRFLAAVAIIVGAIYAGMLALAVLVQPQPREISVTIPQDRFSKPR